MPARLRVWKDKGGYHLKGGEYVPPFRGWQLLDSGTANLTGKRIVFRGDRKTVEVPFRPLFGAEIDPLNDWLKLNLPNRAVVLQPDDLLLFQAAFEAALSRFQGRPPPPIPPAVTSVFLIDRGTKRFKVIKAIIDGFRLDIGQAMTLVADSEPGSPQLVAFAMPIQEAMRLVDALQAVGARAEWR